MNKLLTLFLLAFTTLTPIISQEYAEEPYNPRNSYGVFVGGGFNLHSADFKKFDGIPSCCPGYETGEGFGINFGIYYSTPMGDLIDLSLRAKYLQLGGLVSRIEHEEGTTLSGNNQTLDFEHRFDASINSLALEPVLEFKLSDQFRLRGGFRIGYLLNGYLNEHLEEVVSPSNGLFTDENGNTSRTRNSYTGDIPNLSSIEAAIMIGASYDLPLNDSYTLFLVPYIDMSLGLTSFVPDFGWTSNSIVGGLGLRYAPRDIIRPKEILPPPPPPPPPPLPPPPPPPMVPQLDASIQAVSVNENGQESDVSAIKVEEFFLKRTHPLLNYVFFGENSSEIPKRYSRITEKEKKDFSFKQLFDMKTMDVYHEILNIVGKRLEFYPQSKLELVGCNSNQNLEANNLSLSQDRAEAVKKYLVSEWHINPDRISVKSRNLPDNPSNLTEQDGIEENRRVEMNANIPQIFEPMIINDTLRTSNPPHIRFKPQIKSDIGVSKWKIITYQNGKELRTFSGSGNIPKAVEWDLETEKEQDYVPTLDKPLQYRLQIVDNDNKIWESAVQELPVKQVTIEYKFENVLPDKEFDIYSMIGFGYNQAELNDRNVFIADKAKKRLRSYSITDIIGYSDRLGNEITNQKLSQKRAYNVAEYLGLNPETTARGLGEKKLLYDNDYPEGRFYSRTVVISITTPIE
ncbi:hypothetical protein EP342_03275 [bacterium]|nr:MAG: hypothetical protein EP342_03275 [bacterium]